MFGCQILDFLRRRYQGLEDCYKVPADRESNILTQGYVGIYWKKGVKGCRILFRIMKWNSFRSVPRIQVELIRLTGCLVFVHAAQGRLKAVGYLWRHSDQCPRLSPNHHRCHRMLADRPQKWNHEHWSHAIFKDESTVSLHHSVHRARVFHLFHGCNNPFNNITITVVDANYGRINEENMSPVLVVPVEKKKTLLPHNTEKGITVFFWCYCLE